jgi:hypothetical protein
VRWGRCLTALQVLQQEAGVQVLVLLRLAVNRAVGSCLTVVCLALEVPTAVLGTEMLAPFMCACASAGASARERNKRKV